MEAVVEWSLFWQVVYLVVILVIFTGLSYVFVSLSIDIYNMKTHNILRYGIMRRLGRGITLSFTLTFRCNLKCEYCSNWLPEETLPYAKESTFEELKAYVEKFPIRIRQVKLSGGSPELNMAFVDFTNWLLDQGYYVAILTNLMHPDVLKRLKPSRRLIFLASYHHTDKWKSISEEKYTDIYNDLRKTYRVVVHEIGKTKLLPYSNLHYKFNKEDMKGYSDLLRVSPDLKAYVNCHSMFSDKAKEKLRMRSNKTIKI